MAFQILINKFKASSQKVKKKIIFAKKIDTLVCDGHCKLRFSVCNSTMRLDWVLLIFWAIL